MKNFLFVRIPSICICFTLITLADVITSLLFGNNTSPYVLVLFLWLILCQVIDCLISKVDFQSWIHYCLTESMVLYLSSLAVFGILFWHGITLHQFILFTVIFLIVDIFIFSYFRKRQQLQADEINELLSNGNKL